MTQSLGAGFFYWDENIQLDENIIQILKFGDEMRLNNFIDSHIELFNNQAESIII